MWGLTRSSLSRYVDSSQVEQAIREAERLTSSEIRVSVARFFWGDVEKVAGKAFHRLGMERTPERNGVLIFLVPSRKRFAVLGDVAIHDQVGQGFWDDVAACLSAHFQRGEFTEGLVDGIHLVGGRLAAHFPRAGGAEPDGLPDEVDFH
jgi:uncharacterized membrane protein